MRVVTTVVAIVTGIFVLAGYFAGYFVQLQPLVVLQTYLVDWAIVVAGMAVLVGVYNLFAVHFEKIRTRQKGGTYGMLLIAAMGIVGFLGIVLGPEDTYVRLTVEAIIMPVEASLMAILAITLIYASIRLLRRRVDAMSVIFLVVALLFLILMMPTPFGPIPGDRALIDFLSQFSRGGARGLLIGIALGTLLTGLRILFGADRPYGGN